MTTAELFIALLMCHALADYPLQGPYLSAAKVRGSEAGRGLVWVHALAAHGAIHGAFVWALTGYVWLGLAEMVLHALIDFARGSRRISFHVDQALHVACKIAWVVIVVVIER